MGNKHIIETDYLHKVYTNTKYLKTVDKTIAKIKDLRKTIKFDAIAFTGTSGAAMAYVLSYKLKLPLVCVRKKDRNHFGDQIEGCVSAKSYIIVDDFIDSGATVNKIVKYISKRMPNARPVAIVLYDDHDYRRSWNDIPIKRVR